MAMFATEFPTSSCKNNAAFLAEVIAWLRGMKSSTVLYAEAASDVERENAHFLSETGEELRLRELKEGEDWSAIGFRHEVPDEFGRLWRTEGILKRDIQDKSQSILRVRSQCLALQPGARLEYPKKTYLIKALLKSDWGGRDHLCSVSDKPKLLTDDEAGIEIAAKIAAGDATRWLPVVYISADDNGGWLLSPQQIEKLAYDLGGIAHVVVEPSRDFSARLREFSGGKNVYGGTVGIALPNRGFIRRLFFSWQIQNSIDLANTAKKIATSIRSQMPSFGWDWSDLQDGALRAQRSALKGNRSDDEINDLLNEYSKQINDLNSEKKDLERRLSDTQDISNRVSDDDEFRDTNLVKLIGPELYSGEVSDRIRYAARIALDASENLGLDDRSGEIFARLLERIPPSPALTEFKKDLRRATKDPKRLANEVTSLMIRHGYQEKSDNKHIRLEPQDGFEGTGSITVPKTPSDSRGQKNLSKQIERAVGVSKL
ncbi:hypothetical protein [Citromicrobium sp. JLT1363]|uniref:hypothetical protein n=1 Tax=Citromicrobium sp. JLT1363 TaxID=517722 RepID=UPI0002E416F6|nr:hypothetical protein [Citromicrobium sp. JLT1363]